MKIIFGHATINADILARNEARLVATKEQYHIDNVHRVVNMTYGLLDSIGTVINSVCCIYPTC